MQINEESEITKENAEALERIRELVLKTHQMKEEAPAKQHAIQENFKMLHEKISGSTHFLTKIKHDIENIKFVLDEDRRKFTDLNNSDYLELSNKSNDEIDEEFRKVNFKLDELRRRVSVSKEQLSNDTKTFQDNLLETAQTLDDASKGNFSPDKKQE